MSTERHRAPTLTRVVTAFAGWAASVFQRIEVRGRPIPMGPVLVVANHQNALLDPLVVFRAAGRPTRPLAKAPLFDQLLLGAVLRVLGGLPVYRKQDDPEQMHRNLETFQAAVAALVAGDALQIYPEGRSHSGPALEPLRTGAARIALAAAAQRRGEPGLRIVPIGLTWDGKHRFRGRVLAEIGEPFSVKPWVTPTGSENPEAVRGLTEEIARRLKEVTLNLPALEDLDLVLAADRIYSREKRYHAFRERDALSVRIPRLRRFAEALEWLRAHEPDTYASLAPRVRRVDGVSRVLGVTEGAVPRRYPRAAVVKFIVAEGLMLFLGFPLAVVGSVVWYPVWLAPQLIVPRVNPEYESVATYKLAMSLFTVPLTLGILGFLGLRSWGMVGAVGAVALGSVVGFVALAWRERWSRVKEDVAIYLRVVSRPRLRGRLAGQRAQLAREFDGVLTRMGR